MSTIEVTPEVARANKAYAAVILDAANLARSLGIDPPTASEIAEDVFATHGEGYVFHPIELQFLYKLAKGDVAEILDAVPADNVPAEISGAWYELRSTRPLLDEVRAFLTDPDDPPDAGEGAGTDAAALLAALF